MAKFIIYCGLIHTASLLNGFKTPSPYGHTLLNPHDGRGWVLYACMTFFEY